MEIMSCLKTIILNGTLHTYIKFVRKLYYFKMCLLKLRGKLVSLDLLQFLFIFLFPVQEETYFRDLLQLRGDASLFTNDISLTTKTEC